jgi:glycosyltransferase involved in cell wall biosynthesis
MVKAWDLRTADRPDVYVANSREVAGRIERFYGRSASVIPPPVDCSRFSLSGRTGDYFLVVARLIPYRRIDLAVDAFTRLGLPLRIIGDGPDRENLERRAGPNVSFLGKLPDSDVETMLSECRALVHPGREDFGIAPLEANASGRPVIAFRGGGALDIVKDGRTGVLFDEPAPESVMDAVERFRDRSWNPEEIREHALGFDVPVFRRRMFEFLSRSVGVSLGGED